MGDDAAAELHDRICAAALTCVARWGIAKTTLEDVAREAGCGRATIYRTFKGGKAEVLQACIAREARRLRAEVDAAAARSGDDLEDVVVQGVLAVARFLAGHEAIRYLLAHEPDAVLPWVAFRSMGPLFDLASRFADPHLARFVPDPDERRRAAEWLTRVVVTYVLNPADGADLTVEADARRLLTTYVLPGIRSTSKEHVTP